MIRENTIITTRREKIYYQWLRVEARLVLVLPAELAAAHAAVRFDLRVLVDDLGELLNRPLNFLL